MTHPTQPTVPPGWPDTWPRTTAAVAERPVLSGAPDWVRRAADLSAAVTWLPALGAWTVDATAPRPAHAGYLGRCDCCRTRLGDTAWVWTDGGAYCGLACLTIAVHTCADCGTVCGTSAAVPPMPAEDGPTAPPAWWS